MSVFEKNRAWATLVPGDMIMWIDGGGRTWYDLVIGVIVRETRVEMTFMLLWQDPDIDNSSPGICSGHFTASQMMSDLGCYKVETDANPT